MLSNAVAPQAAQQGMEFVFTFTSSVKIPLSKTIPHLNEMELEEKVGGSTAAPGGI